MVTGKEELRDWHNSP